MGTGGVAGEGEGKGVMCSEEVRGDRLEWTGLDGEMNSGGVQGG